MALWIETQNGELHEVIGFTNDKKSGKIYATSVIGSQIVCGEYDSIEKIKKVNQMIVDEIKRYDYVTRRIEGTKHRAIEGYCNPPKFFKFPQYYEVTL